MSSIQSFRSAMTSDRAKKVLPMVAAGIILLIAALVVYVLLVTPSKQPYRDALSQYKNVYNANVALINSGKALNASNATDEQFTASVKDVQTALTNLKTENEELSKQTVLTTGKGKTLYTDFSQKLEQYIAYNANILASIEKVRPVIYDCNNKMAGITESQASVDAIHACTTNLEQIPNIPDDDYQAVVKGFVADYTNLASVTESMIALKDPKGADSAQYQALSNQRTDILNDLNTTSTTFSKNLQTHQQAVDITDTAKALDDYLTNKSSVFSF